MLQGLSVGLFKGDLETGLRDDGVVRHAVLDEIEARLDLGNLSLGQRTFLSYLLHSLLHSLGFKLKFLYSDLLGLSLHNQPFKGLEAVKGLKLVFWR